MRTLSLSSSTSNSSCSRLPNKTNNSVYLQLFLSCTIMLGLYYLISMPASVRQHLKETTLALGNDEITDNFETLYQLTFTLAFAPGIILPFFAGSAVDRIGARSCMIVLSTICQLGQMMAALGVQWKTWMLILCGRLVFGIGFESLFVANAAFLSILCGSNDKKQRLGMALGACSAASFIGYLLSPVLSPRAANSVSVAFAFWVGAIFMGLSVLASLAIFFIAPNRLTSGCCVITVSASRENNSENEDGSRVVELEAASSQCQTSRATTQENSRQNIHILSVLRHFDISFWLLCISCAIMYGVTDSFTGVASGLLLEQHLFVDPPSDCVLQYPSACPSGYIAIENNPAMDTDGNACPTGEAFSPVLPLSINVTTARQHHDLWDHSHYEFNSLSKEDIECADKFWSMACMQEYCDRQESATEHAGVLMAVPFIVTVLTTFLFGYYGVDRARLHFSMVAFAPALLVVAHALLATGKVRAIIPLILIGLGFSIYVSAVWPSVAVLVSKDATGTAFGIITCIQAIGNAVFPLLVTAVYNNTGKIYVPYVEMLLLVFSILVLSVGVSLQLIQCRKRSFRSSHQ